jgi:NADH-quinone oxidoreductase subunit K
MPVGDRRRAENCWKWSSSSGAPGRQPGRSAPPGNTSALGTGLRRYVYPFESRPWCCSSPSIVHCADAPQAQGRTPDDAGKVRRQDRVRLINMPSKAGNEESVAGPIRLAAATKRHRGFIVPLLTAPTLAHYLVLGAILFAVSMAGIFLIRKNVIIMLRAIELMLLAVNLNFIAFSSYLGDMSGQVFVFFILTVAAAESAIGLAILILLFRNAGSINVEDLGKLRG